MDLFSPIVEESKRHKLFETAIGAFGEGERDVLQSWADGFPDRDGKFVREFQTSFNSCFWELYLHALFREYGFTFDWSHVAPDFLVSKEDASIVVEATTSNTAQGKVAPWDLLSTHYSESQSVVELELSLWIGVEHEGRKGSRS